MRIFDEKVFNLSPHFSYRNSNNEEALSKMSACKGDDVKPVVEDLKVTYWYPKARLFIAIF